MPPASGRVMVLSGPGFGEVGLLRRGRIIVGWSRCLGGLGRGGMNGIGLWIVGRGAIRGPGLHVSPELRRLWRCPKCGRERMVGQAETTVVCRCQDPPVFMQLVEPKRVVRPEPRPVAHFYDEADLPEDDSVVPIPEYVTPVF